MVAMFSCFKTKSEKKCTTRGLFISAMSHVKLIAETPRLCMPQKKMKFMGFLQFLESFRGKIYSAKRARGRSPIAKEMW